jgi:hypothetical protein
MRHSLWKSLMNPSQYLFGYRMRISSPNHRTVRTPARIGPYPTGRLFLHKTAPERCLQIERLVVNETRK